MDIKETIRARMDDLGLDALKLAFEMNALGCECSYHNAYNWWSGKSTPRAEAIPYLAKALKYESVDEFFGLAKASGA